MDFITIIDYIGTFAFAISGIRLAAAKNFDIFGAYVVGFVTAIGGGTLRDLLLGLTPFWMENVSYTIITAVALLFVIIFRKHLFTVVGVERSLAEGYPFWVNIIMGAITGAAGGMFRDIFINEVPLIFRKDIYAVACVLGGVVYYICRLAGCGHILTQILAATSVILTRILSVHFGISLPSLRPIEDARQPEK